MSTTFTEIELTYKQLCLAIQSRSTRGTEFEQRCPGKQKCRPFVAPRLRSISIISIFTGVSFLNTLGSGIPTVALPRLPQDLDLERNLILWPASVYALTAGCILLILDAVADVIGAKNVWLAGSCLFAVFTLACGLARPEPIL